MNCGKYDSGAGIEKMKLLMAVLLPLCVGIGIAQIFIGLSMYRSFRLRFLLDYLYLLICLNIFGFIIFIGTAFADYVLIDLARSPQNFRAFNQVLSFVATPFLIVAWYFFILMTRNLVEKKLPGIFLAVFICLMGITILAQGLLIIGYQGEPTGSLSPFLLIWRRILRYIGTPFIAFAIGQLFFYAGNLQSEKKKEMVRRLGWIYIILYILFYTLPFLLRKSHMWGIVYPFLHFTIHLWPILYIRNFLRHFFVEESIKPENEKSLLEIFTKNNISPREQEVVRLILKGKSYKDIERELFISVRTVRNHMSNIYRKLKVKNRFQMINLFRNMSLAEETNNLSR